MRKTNTKSHFSSNLELNTAEIYASFVFTMITLYLKYFIRKLSKIETPR